jgi:hypothetical protein
MSYLSLELRFSHLMHCAITSPILFKECESKHKAMQTLSGFRTSVCHLLGIPERQALLPLKDRQLADLLYRDNLILKHSASNHIKKALSDQLNTKQTATARDKEDAHAITLAIIDFLVEAS